MPRAGGLTGELQGRVRTGDGEVGEGVDREVQRAEAAVGSGAGAGGDGVLRLRNEKVG